MRIDLFLSKTINFFEVQKKYCTLKKDSVYYPPILQANQEMILIYPCAIKRLHRPGEYWL